MLILYRGSKNHLCLLDEFGSQVSIPYRGNERKQRKFLDLSVLVSIPYRGNERKMYELVVFKVVYQFLIEVMKEQHFVCC